VSTYTDVTADDEDDLLVAAAAGCVSVGVEADQFAFQYYSSGVLTGFLVCVDAPLSTLMVEVFFTLFKVAEIRPLM